MYTTKPVYSKISILSFIGPLIAKNHNPTFTSQKVVENCREGPNLPFYSEV